MLIPQSTIELRSKRPTDPDRLRNRLRGARQRRGYHGHDHQMPSVFAVFDHPISRRVPVRNGRSRHYGTADETR